MCLKGPQHGDMAKAKTLETSLRKCKAVPESLRMEQELGRQTGVRKSPLFMGKSWGGKVLRKDAEDKHE